VPGQSCQYCFRTPAEQMAATIAARHEAIARATTPMPGSVPYSNYRPVTVPADCDGWKLLDVMWRIVRHLPAGYWEQECALDRMEDEHHAAVPADRIVRAGERYLHRFPDVIEPDVNGNIRVLHEDEALIVLNKPAPLPMHSGGRFFRNTLQYVLEQVYHPQKPRPAHRLDANTTGLVLVTRTRHFAGLLQPQFARGEVEKTYLVRVAGRPPSRTFSCDASISAEAGALGSRTVDMANGLAARTEFTCLQDYDDGTSLLEARPLTGRTNQIRIHCAHLGFPVCGDPAYLLEGRLGRTQTLAVSDPPLCLHAWKIGFRHPLTRLPVAFTAPAPDWAA
jgi:UPF0176 protein